MNKFSQETLRLVEERDPTLKAVRIGNFYFGELGMYKPRDSVDLVKLGKCIAQNDHVEDIQFDNFRGLHVMATAAGDSFFAGLQSSKSIHSLHLSHCNISEELGRRILFAFTKMKKLTIFRLWRCEFGNEGRSILTTLVNNSRNLQYMNLQQSLVDDELLETIVALSPTSRLEVLKLEGNSIGKKGCDALARLLQNKHCKLITLELENNHINDEGVTALTTGLLDNSTLKHLCLNGNPLTTTASGDAFSRVLCNSSSIEATHSSNHTLELLSLDKSAVVDNDAMQVIHSNLELNGSSSNKNQVTVRKILLNHSHFNMGPFLKWDMKMLPLIMKWFDNARDCTKSDKAGIERRNLCSLYQFARAMPREFGGIM